LQNIGTLHTLNESLGEIKDGAIYVKGNVIQWVGKTAELPAEFTAADEVISLENRVVIPGMVNTHHHMVQSLTRCVAQVSQVDALCQTRNPYPSLYSIKSGFRTFNKGKDSNTGKRDVVMLVWWPAIWITGLRTP
jgi:predicted amidohydrolase YtcJ